MGQKLTVSRYRLPAGLQRPLRVLCISDLHGETLGGRVLKRVLSLKPDLVVVTGDSVGADLSHLTEVSALMRGLALRYPVVAILGNHERRSGCADLVVRMFEGCGVICLRNELCSLHLNGTVINILGLDEGKAISRRDYLLEAAGRLSYYDAGPLFSKLERMGGVRIVLSHFPENFALIGSASYRQHDFDIMFSGHAHGGQWRLPFMGGVFCAGQGLFPMYDAGLYRGRMGPALAVSRGIGNDTFLPRINNPPELMLVTLM